MKDVYVCFGMPDKGKYVGGVASILNSYFLHKDKFSSEGYSIKLFDTSNAYREKISFTPLRMFAAYFGEKKYTRNFSINTESVFHIHTSRNFLFCKDVFFGRYIKKRYKCKTYLTIHVGDYATVMHFFPSFAASILIRHMNRYFDRIIFMSKKIKDQFIEHGLKPDQCEVLYNFHDLRELRKDNVKPDIPKKGLNLVFVGMINRDKGILDLLRAMLKCADIPLHLDICGLITDNSIEDDYKNLVAELNSRVTENGYIKGVDKTNLLCKSDVLVLPSYHEGLPLVVLEAMASGLGLIVTKVGAIPEILSDQNAVFIEPGDINSIEQAIRQLYFHREQLEDLKRNNFSLAEKYCIETHIEKLCAIYNAR